MIGTTHDAVVGYDPPYKKAAVTTNPLTYFSACLRGYNRASVRFVVRIVWLRSVVLQRAKERGELVCKFDDE